MNAAPTKIGTGEIFVRDFGAVIRTRAFKSDIDDVAVARAALVTKLATGDEVVVQCMSHARDVVLWQRRYVVAERRDFLKRTENDRGSAHTAETFECRVVPTEDWLSVTPEPKPEAKQEPETKAAAPKGGAKKAEPETKAAA